MVDEPPLRERKKQRTRDQVIEAALRLFAKNGYEATTVEEIAAAAEVAPRTFYRYFPTKEAVIFLDQDLENDAVMRTLTERRQGESDFDVLTRAMLSALAVGATDRKHLAAVYKLMLSTPALQGKTFELTLRGEQIFVEGLLANRPRTRDAEFRARLLAASLTAVARVVFAWWMESDQKIPLFADFEKAINYLRYGFEEAAEAAIEETSTRARTRRARTR